MVLTTLPCFLKASTGQKSKAAPWSQTSTPAHYMCHRFFSASGWWICSRHNYCTTQYYKIDAPIHGMWRELGLKIDFFFQTSKSLHTRNMCFKRKFPLSNVVWTSDIDAFVCSYLNSAQTSYPDVFHLPNPPKAPVLYLLSWWLSK